VDQQKLVQMMPDFLANLSQHMHALPPLPQICNHMSNTQPEQIPQDSWLQPWTAVAHVGII